MSNSHYTPDSAAKGALLQNNFYGWIAEGTGRMDLCSNPTITFDYADMVVKDKKRIVNPLAHIQFAASLKAIRAMYSKDGYYYASSNYESRGNVAPIWVDKSTDTSVLDYYRTISGDHTEHFTQKFLLKPTVDEFNLLPKLVADASGYDVCGNPTDLSYTRLSYVNVTCGAGARGVDIGAFNNADDRHSVFQVLDLSNNVDGTNDCSFNVIAAFKLYAKYNHPAGETTEVWPMNKGATSLTPGVTYTIDGFNVTPKSRTKNDVSFVFRIWDDGLGGTTGLQTDCSYIVRVIHGDLKDLSFTGGIQTLPNGSNLICTNYKGAQSSSTLISNAESYSIDISFTGYTLDDQFLPENNSDSYFGDIMLPITGTADISGGLQCIHVPDSLKNIRRDAASSLAANFAGLTELLGDVSINSTTIPDVSASEINNLAENDASGGLAPGTSDGTSHNDVNGLFTISGDILSNRLMNFMKGSPDYAGVVSSKNEHIHKVVYSRTVSSADVIYPDASLACLARDSDASTNIAEVELAGDFVGVSAEIVELTPQESAFFYLYPWASPEMCAVNSITRQTDTNGFNAAAGKSNPFRLFQEEYLNKLYTDPLDLDSILGIIPTAKGWLDNSGGYYNTEKGRAEWYSFVDICYNNNLNAVQTTDVSYIYQNVADDVSGCFRLCPLDIVFPDISALNPTIVNNAQGPDGSVYNNDFCTLNFQIPLKADTASVQRRFDKVSNLTGGNIQLANESYTITSGFTAKCHATANGLSSIPGNIPELLNSYMPVVVRLMDDTTF